MSTRSSLEMISNNSYNQNIPVFDVSDIQLTGHLGSGSFAAVYSFRRRRPATSKEINDGQESQDGVSGEFTGRTMTERSSSNTSCSLDQNQNQNELSPQSSSDETEEGEDVEENRTPAPSKLTVTDGYFEKEFALKRLRGRGSDGKGWSESFSRQAIRDLRNELRILTTLPAHPNIVTLYGISDDFWKKPLRGFLVLERLVETLDKSIERWKLEQQQKSTFQFPKRMFLGKRALLEQQQAERIQSAAVGTARAVAFLHRYGYIYRDLKPDNLGFDALDGTIRLFDLALAHRLDGHDHDKTDNETATSYCDERIGTLRYMAPEVALGARYNVKADVHSFATVLWHILTLEKPYQNARDSFELSMLVCQKDVTPPVTPATIASATVRQLLADCWKANPRERPSMTRVVQRLEEEEEGQGINQTAHDKKDKNLDIVHHGQQQQQQHHQHQQFLRQDELAAPNTTAATRGAHNRLMILGTLQRLRCKSVRGGGGMRVEQGFKGDNMPH